MANDKYDPRPEHKFSFGLWTVGNRGRDPFGEAVRPSIPPNDIVALLAEVGAWGVNLHDNDLVPIDATPAERDRIVREFKAACQQHGIVVPMATVNLFYDPVFRDGAFTANDPAVRAYAVQKTMTAMDLGAELGAKIFVLWGGREGTETDACRRPDDAVKRLREALNYLCEYNLDKKYGFKFAMEAKPNEPRGDIYMATTGAYLGFIPTLDHPEMVGVNPEVAHEQMPGLNMLHAVAQAWEAGKLFHIDLNDQNPGRYDQDFRFASAQPKAMFWLVKFLEDVGYEGPRHFDAHAYRTEDIEGVKDFARGCMRTYVILKEKARQWNEDPEIQAIVKEFATESAIGKYSPEGAKKLLATGYDRAAMAKKGLQYEKLDQLTMELLMGVR
jgi:xylose isomerase